MKVEKTRRCMSPNAMFQSPLAGHRSLVEHGPVTRGTINRQFADKRGATLAVDAGTIRRRHLVDVVVIYPEADLQPFLRGAVKRLKLMAT
jgi:hypothetical protein